jgi:Putative restriction endonuclease
MAAQPKTYLTVVEYLAVERRSPEKAEYLDGAAIAMSGVSRERHLIVTNLVRELSLRLKGRPCEVYPSDLRLKAPATGLYTYPDVAVVCGEPRFEDEERDTLLNPTLLIEVLSPSTESYDRGKKFEQPRQPRRRSSWSRSVSAGGCSSAQRMARSRISRAAVSWSQRSSSGMTSSSLTIHPSSISSTSARRSAYSLPRSSSPVSSMVLTVAMGGLASSRSRATG